MKTINDEEFIFLTKILGDQTRLSILRILSQRGSLCACKILEELHISQGTLSHHMKQLTKYNLVTCRKDGKWRHYCLLPNTLCEMAAYIREICASPTNCQTSSCQCQKESE
ncbi:MAG: transcriptional regulator [Bacteroidia bacterium]|nr:transcriptional regulator [Bacteroidia bacterium]